VPLPDVKVIRDLGVMIDSNLSFSAHYASITAKAHQRAALILRCFKSRDPHLLFRAFVVYVRPLLEYCSPVWSPVNIGDINKIEAVQRRFTKKLKGYRQLNYSERLKLLNSDSLELRRLKLDLVTMYKIINGHLEADGLFAFSVHGLTRGHNQKLEKPLCNNNARAFSLSCRQIDCWNYLPEHVVNSQSVNSFKAGLDCINFTKFLTIETK
jgi:hypothetical protein